MPGLVIDNVCKSFDNQVVLDAVSLTVDPGSLMVVLGPSGCGKSTLLRLIAGLEQADGGTITLDDIDITAMEPQKRKTGMVFQNYALYPHMTVFENMAFPLKVAGENKTTIKRVVTETAELLELGEMLEKRPAQLSGGQRQRVALGRGLVRKPSIFLLDEPLSNLDAALRTRMRREIVSLQKKLGITMIYVTHDQTEALTMADHMIVLKDGVIRQRGTPAELYDNPGNTFVASFIGSPPINLFDDDIKNGRGIRLPVIYDNGKPDGAFTIGIRPEHITIAAGGSCSGKITSQEYIGPVRYLKVTTGSIELTISEDSSTARRMIGETIEFTINPDAIYIFDRQTGRRIV